MDWSTHRRKLASNRLRPIRNTKSTRKHPVMEMHNEKRRRNHHQIENQRDNCRQGNVLLLILFTCFIIFFYKYCFIFPIQLYIFIVLYRIIHYIVTSRVLGVIWKSNFTFHYWGIVPVIWYVSDDNFWIRSLVTRTYVRTYISYFCSRIRFAWHKKIL